jgi:DNA repair protein RadA/Sms
MTRPSKMIWKCTQCQQLGPKWAGQCHNCKAWNTLEEVQGVFEKESLSSTAKVQSKLWRLQDVASQESLRKLTGIKELDRLLGGGVVPGSMILLGGDPGIGKSTLLLQVSANMSKKGQRILYVSGEESIPQICLRAQRLGIKADSVFLLSETRMDQIKAHIEIEKPDFVIIDSIQIVYKTEIPSSAGSVVQVRECAAELLHTAKTLHIPIILIGHVTKNGDIAGPRVLEHMVDTVLYFESDLEAGIRCLRAVKNRFGTTDEIAVFQMKETGLEEVSNPSALFIRQDHEYHSGSAVVPTLEGSRAILVETQALVSRSFYPQPTRKASGFDPNRLAVLLAVLEKKVGIGLHTQDVFISIAGGLRIHEPALDLAVAASIVSSLTSKAIDPRTAVMAEVALCGQLRPVARSDLRLKELAHMGFKKCVVAKGRTHLSSPLIQVIEVASLKEALDVLSVT